MPGWRPPAWRERLKKRPLGIPSFEDKLVQEVVRLLLEAIYEGHFEGTSHGDKLLDIWRHICRYVTYNIP